MCFRSSRRLSQGESRESPGRDAAAPRRSQQPGKEVVKDSKCPLPQSSPRRLELPTGGRAGRDGGTGV